jgi:hypothetical protein
MPLGMATFSAGGKMGEADNLRGMRADLHVMLTPALLAITALKRKHSYLRQYVPIEV